ncbi:MAG: putative signal transducing protein [Candidatus Humimicrobiaceae bacterium]
MNEKIKLLKTFSNRIDAELAKSFLESNGIKSMVSADDVGEMYPAASVYWGVKLFVNENNFEIANSLLNNLEEV